MVHTDVSFDKLVCNTKSAMHHARCPQLASIFLIVVLLFLNSGFLFVRERSWLALLTVENLGLSLVKINELCREFERTGTSGSQHVMGLDRGGS